eukprot:scaffold7160_cov156-Ochromonas_danica.AAC.6
MPGMNPYSVPQVPYGQHQPLWESPHESYGAVKVPTNMSNRTEVPAYSVVSPPPPQSSISNQDYYSPRFAESSQMAGYPSESVEEVPYYMGGPYASMPGMPMSARASMGVNPLQTRFMAPTAAPPSIHMQQQYNDPYRAMKNQSNMVPANYNMGGPNVQGRAINKQLLDILRDRVVDAQRLDLLIDTYVERMDCVNLATLLFHTGKKRLVLIPTYVRRVAQRLLGVKEDLRAREASNALYGLKCLSSDIPEVRELVHALATKIASSNSDFVAQAVGNALYGCQMMTSEYEEVRYLLLILASKVSRCTELLEAQNVGNALYGLRGMNSDHKEVRIMISALTPKVASAREELNGQALGNSLYGLQCMSSKEPEVRCLLQVLAAKVARTWEDLKAQEVGNALYGLKRMSTDVPEVRSLIVALVPKIAQSPDVLDAQAVGNSLYGLQNMRSDSSEVLSLLSVLAEKIGASCAELDGQAMGNSLYGLQGMSSDFPEVRAVVAALTVKIQSSCLEMNAQELGNALYGLHNMNSSYKEVRKIVAALAQKIAASKHELTSQEIGNAMFGLQNMSSEHLETRLLLQHLTQKIVLSHTVLDPQGVSNSLFGLQRLSSECLEVRHLVHALAYKVEHCWKVLGTHHVSNACFGLQGLSSEEKEVRMLLKALVPKIVSCREEMNAKQLSYALFGLHKMSSNHLEVLGLVTALADKIVASTDSWNSYYLSLAVFGLQGMSSSSEEVTYLIKAINQKASMASLVDMDAVKLGNSFYGLQRFDTNNAEVCKLLMILGTSLMNMIQYNMKVPASACANIIFGLNGLSVHVEPVRGVLDTVAELMRDIIDTSGNLGSLRHELAVETYMELLTMFQAAAVSVNAIPDLDAYPETKLRLNEQIPRLQSIIEQYSRLYQPRGLTYAETLAAQEISRILNREPFVIRTGALMYGFDSSLFIQLSPNLELKTASGAPFNPVLGLDLIGSSFCFPAKELFHTLRCRYLGKQRGLTMRALPADSFRVVGQGGIWMHQSVFVPLLAENDEDTKVINAQLSSRSNSSVSYMSSLNGGDESLRYHLPAASGSNASLGRGQGIETNSLYSQSSGTVNRYGISEYLDDDFIKQGNDYVSEQLGLRYNRRPLGLLVGWLGDWPRISNLLLVHLLSMQQQPVVQQQQQQQQSFGRFAGAYPGAPIRMNGTPVVDVRRQVADRGMMPVVDMPLDSKSFSMRSQSVDYLNNSSDSTFMETAQHLRVGRRTEDENSDTSADISQTKTIKPIFDHNHPGINLATVSEHSLSGLLSRSYSQFPAESGHHDTMRMETTKYDASGTFLSPDFSQSNSFTGNMLRNSQDFHQYSKNQSFIKPESLKQRTLSDASLLEENAVVAVTNIVDLGPDLSVPQGAGVPVEQQPSNITILNTADENSSQHVAAVQEVVSTEAHDEDDMALLQAQMEMAKLEAKIKSLQDRKSLKGQRGATDTLLATTSSDSY